MATLKYSPSILENVKKYPFLHVIYFYMLMAVLNESEETTVVQASCLHTVYLDASEAR